MSPSTSKDENGMGLYGEIFLNISKDTIFPIHLSYLEIEPSKGCCGAPKDLSNGLQNILAWGLDSF